MVHEAAPLTPEQVLAALKDRSSDLFNNVRRQYPTWIPELPVPRTFHLRRSNLSNMDLRGMDFSGIDLSGADLFGTKLDGADFSNANLAGARLNDTTVSETVFIGAKGLYGTNRARLAPYQDTIDSGSESAVFRKPGDHVPWSVLRSISTLRVFGASYVLIIVLVAYAGMVEWINDIAFRWASMMPASGEYTQHFRELLLSKMPLIEVAPHFGIQLLMVLCLAIGATIYEFYCPDVVKENTENAWTRELNQSLIEYRAADASHPRARTATFFFYGIGGLYTLVYLFVRIVRAILYFLGLLGTIYI